MMQECTFTWRSAFSRIGWHSQDAFEDVLTAGI